MIVAIGCDPNAAQIKKVLVEVVTKRGYEVVDFGGDDPIYANTAFKVAEYVAEKKADRGVLLCGTGLGMCISANKVKGAYAALISDSYSAERSIKSNNANIACFGAFTLGPKLIENLLLEWLECEYVPGTSSEKKLQRYVDYDLAR